MAADDVRLAHVIDAAALRHRLARRNHARAGGNAIARIDLTDAAGTIRERHGSRRDAQQSRDTAQPLVTPDQTHPAFSPRISDAGTLSQIPRRSVTGN